MSTVVSVRSMILYTLSNRTRRVHFRLDSLNLDMDIGVCVSGWAVGVDGQGSWESWSHRSSTLICRRLSLMFSIECHQVLLLRHQERIHVGPSTKPGMGGLREVTGRRQTCWRMRPARRVCDGGASEVSRDGDLKL